MQSIGHGFRAVAKALAEWDGTIGELVSRLDRQRVPFLSFSKLSTVEFCEHRYLLEYVEGVQLDEEPAYFSKGNTFHAAASMAYQQMNEGNTDIEMLLTRVREHRPKDHHAHLSNAVTLMVQNAHRGYTLVATEHPFVLSLGRGLPPLVGVIDLLLRKGQTFLAVDHKTGKNFYHQDKLQLLLYGEYVRRAFKPKRCLACYDEYRWVNNLDRIRKPAFRRTHVRSSPRSWPVVLRRIKNGFDAICRITKTGRADSGTQCYMCPFKDSCERAVVTEWGSWW